MKLSTFLKAAVALLVVKISLTILNSIIPLEEKYPLLYSFLYLFAQLLEAFTIIVVYTYVKKFEYQKIYLLPVIFMALFFIYDGLTRLYPIPTPLDSASSSGKMLHEVVFTGFPAIIYLIMIVIFVIQLLKNQSPTQERNIKFVGMAYIISIALILSISILLYYMARTETRYTNLIFELPSLAMINLYLNKLKEKEIQLPDIGE